MNELTLQTLPVIHGGTLYDVLTTAGGLAWNGTTFESYSPANQASYAIAKTEQSTQGLYYASFPTAITACDIYQVTTFGRAGATPSARDPIVGFGNIAWNGASAAPVAGGVSLAPTDTTATSVAAIVANGVKANSGPQLL